MLNATCVSVLREIRVQELQQLNFIINRMTHHDLSMVIVQGEDKPSASEPPIATMSFRAEGSAWVVALHEQLSTPTCRLPYDEDAIVAMCRVDQHARAISLEAEPSFSAIEVIVAMTKALHQSLYPDAPGKWVFCRWESEAWPLNGVGSGLVVKLSKTLGSRLTKSEVLVGEECIGCIYFSAMVER